jgi:hypothetical protein
VGRHRGGAGADVLLSYAETGRHVQGLALVHVRAQLEQLQDTFMS